jgi:arginine exporter protein ArgO
MVISGVDVVCAMVATVGFSNAFVRAEGGPAAWLRDRVIAPVLKRVGLAELNDCVFCASVWFGMAMAGLLLVDPGIVRVLAVVGGGAAMVWVLGQAPVRTEQGCAATKRLRAEKRKAEEEARAKIEAARAAGAGAAAKAQATLAEGAAKAAGGGCRAA